MSASELLEAAWSLRRKYDRHDLAHELFALSAGVARSQGDLIGEGYALLALNNNLVWHCPPEVEQSNLDINELAERALELFTSADHQPGIAASLRNLGRCEESIELCRRINHRAELIKSLERLGLFLAVRKDLEAAARAYEEALALAEQEGDRYLLAHVLQSQGIGLPLEDTARREVFLRAARLYQELECRPDHARTLQIAASLTCDDEPALGEQLLAQAAKIRAEFEQWASAAICMGLKG